jgi:hypothetical protein
MTGMGDMPGFNTRLAAKCAHAPSCTMMKQRCKDMLVHSHAQGAAAR